MGVMGIRTTITNERGVALPMALITLVLLTTLMLAFAVLSQTEPVIAANQLRVSQARSLAEGGFELAVWALSNSLDPKGLSSPLPATMPTTFDGTTFTFLGGTGGFTVAVVNDPSGDANVRQVTSVGWTPTNSGTDTRTKGVRKIQASVVVIPNLALSAPCALCVKGELSVGGNSTINGNNTDASCGGNTRFGTYTSGATTTGGSAAVSGGAGGVAQNQGDAPFNGFTYSNADLNALKALARKNGTYFGPGFSGATDTNGKAVTGTWSGSLSFNSSNPVANGVVFIDTSDGNNVNPTGSDLSTLASVDIHGNPFVAGDFQGVLVVNGSLSISGNMAINGLVYAVNDFTYNGTGTGGINGLAISQNIRDTSVTSIDTSTSGNSRITFNCQYATAPLLIPPGFNIVPGSYREIAGQ